MPTLHDTEVSASLAKGPRMKPTSVTPAEAKEVWDMLAKPSSRKVADWFRAAGRPVGHHSICKWKLAGWPGASAADVAKAAATALANIERVVSGASVAVRQTMADVVEPDATATAVQEACEPADGRGNAECAEAALRETLACATSVLKGIRHIAAAAPKGDAARPDARPALLLGEPDGIAKLIMAASTAINTAVDGFRHLSRLRAEEAAAVPGTQTVYPPGEGPHAESSHADGLHGEQDYPSRSTIEAIDHALKEFREGKP